MEESAELVPRVPSRGSSESEESGSLNTAVVESPMDTAVAMHLISDPDGTRAVLSPLLEVSPRVGDSSEGSGGHSRIAPGNNINENASGSGGSGGGGASLRVASLDGLRGLAAATVLISHCILVSPAISDTMAVPHPSSASWFVYLIAYTTLHIFWAGGESVMLFFVLSGYVLTLPAANGRKPNWWAYYPSRLARLYVPIFAATIYSFILLQMTKRGPDSTMSAWMNYHYSSFTAEEVIREATVVTGTNAVNSVFWSLQWEVLFSLILPVYVWVLIQHKAGRWVKLAVLVGLILASEHITNPPKNEYVNVPYIFKQMPLFGIGAWMAQQRPWIENKISFMNRWPNWGHMVWHFCVWTVLLFPWYLSGGDIKVPSIECLFQIPAIMLIMAWTAFTEKGKSMGGYRVVAWLGSRSFSIYLVHEPLIVTIGYAMHSTNGLLSLVIVAPTALVTAELFYRGVELPAHRFSRWLNKSISDRTKAKPTTHGITA